MNIYYITVKFTGTPIVQNTNSDSDNSTTWTPLPITFNITDLDWKSKGQLQFSEEINMTNLYSNFKTFMKVYVDSRTRNLTEDVVDIELTSNA
jgi:hypothetical protein